MNILVVGASRGLGFQLASVALERGHKVVATYRGEIAPSLVELKQDYESQLYLVQLELLNEDSIINAAREVKLNIGKLNCIINNAGILLGRHDTIATIKLEELQDSFAVNLFGPMLVMKHFDDLLDRKETGVVVNVSSEAALDMGPQDLPYSLTKNALNVFSTKLQAYYADSIVKVYAVHPGWMRTDMGGPNAHLDPKLSAQRITDIVEGKTVPDKIFIEIL